MPSDQTLIFAIFAVLFALLVWGRFRYDLVAFGALVLAAALGLVPKGGCVLGLRPFRRRHHCAGADRLEGAHRLGGHRKACHARLLDSRKRPLPLHIAVMAVVGAAISAVINNVAALALSDATRRGNRHEGQACRRQKSDAAFSFATILGGMITLIGTPPNIVIAEYRQDALGDFLRDVRLSRPSGLAVAAAGIACSSRLSAGAFFRGAQDRWSRKRALPRAATSPRLRVGEKALEDGLTVRDLYPLANEHDVHILGLVRRGKRQPGFRRAPGNPRQRFSWWSRASRRPSKPSWVRARWSLRVQ